MENQRVRIETVPLGLKAQRGLRKDLLATMDATAVMVQAGLDFGYAWPEAVRSGSGGVLFTHWASLGEVETVSAALQRLGQGYPDPNHRLWFGVLNGLYRQGAPLSATLDAVCRSLRQEQDRDWQAHLRGLGLKVSLILAFCFVLPALGLVFVPLLAEITESFQ